MPSFTDVDAQRTIDQTISEHQDRISELEERILKHRAAILALNTRRNTHSSISKLPTELIANIFLHAKHYAIASKSTNHDGDKNRNWMNVSPVCRQWRAIFLDTPQLWCSIDLSWQAGCIFEFIKRSKSVPLRVLWRWASPDSGQFEPVVKAVMSQSIHELDISAICLGSLKWFFKLNPSRIAPALEVLKLRSALYDPSTTLPRPWHDMPALRFLGLENIHILPDLPMCPCLTRLVVHPSEFQHLSASWLVRLLRNTPLIEVIEVLELSSDFGAETPASPISLPKLSSLTIRADSFGASKIFDYIDYHSAIVSFTCFKRVASVSVPGFTSLQHLCSQFTARYRATSPDQVRILVSDRFLEVLLSPSATQPPHLILRLALPERHPITRYVQLCSLLPLATVRTVTLVGFQNSSNAEWLTLFPLCREVTSLCLDRCRGVDILVGLLTPNDSDPLRLPMAKLETIVMRGCTLDCSRAERYDDTVEAIVSILKQRKTHGVAIQTLQVENCNVARRVIEVFEGVAEVQWDGMEVAEGLEGVLVDDGEFINTTL